MKKIFSCSILFLISTFAFLSLKNPQVALSGAANGLFLSAKVIIPSLFPFTFAVLYILKSGILYHLSFLDKFSKKIFHLNIQQFIIFILSLVGGYPIGAKLLNESDNDPRTNGIMLNFCVNAGPAFIISAVGAGIWASTQIGVILFVAHIIPPFVLVLFLGHKITYYPRHQKHISPTVSDNFTSCAAQSATALMNICTYVILFSIITSHLEHLTPSIPFLKNAALLLEVTNAVSSTRNILLTSAVLGFGGVCIWCQMFSLATKFEINFTQFVLCRIFHALLSSALTFVLLKIIKPQIATLSTGSHFSADAFFTSGAVGVSLLVMGIVLIISLYSKKYAGNLMEDIV